MTGQKPETVEYYLHQIFSEMAFCNLCKAMTPSLWYMIDGVANPVSVCTFCFLPARPPSYLGPTYKQIEFAFPPINTTEVWDE